VLFAHFVPRHQKERGESDGKQRDGKRSMQLIKPVGVEIAVKQGEPHEDKEDVRTKDAKRRFAESEKRLNGNQAR
jgi:hypothetical protein